MCLDADTMKSNPGAPSAFFFNPSTCLLIIFIFLRAKELPFTGPHLHRRYRAFLYPLCLIEILALEHATPTLLLYLSETSTDRSQRQQTVIIEHYECAMQLPSIWKCSPTASQPLCQKCCVLDWRDCSSKSNSAMSYTSGYREQRKLNNWPS